MQEAQNMIAREYSLFMSAKKRDFVTAFADLFSDEPDDKINTFVAVDNNSLVSSTGNILATIRIAFGDTAKQPPLEAFDMELARLVSKLAMKEKLASAARSLMLGELGAGSASHFRKL